MLVLVTTQLRAIHVMRGAGDPSSPRECWGRYQSPFRSPLSARFAWVEEENLGFRKAYRFFRDARSCRLRNPGKPRIHATELREMQTISTGPPPLQPMHIARSHRTYGLLKRKSYHGFSSSNRSEPAQQSHIDWPKDTRRPDEVINERTQAWKSLAEAGAASRGIVCL